MKKSKIALKLTLYFSVALIVFAIIVSMVFLSVFSSYNKKAIKDDMQEQAKRISKSMASFYQQEENSSHNQQEEMGAHNGGGHMKNQFGHSFEAYLKYMNDLSISPVWYIDKGSERINGETDVQYYQLSDKAKKDIQRAFGGETVTSNNFTQAFGEKTVTVATPIYLSEKGNVGGVILLHSAVSDISDSAKNAMKILSLVILCALIAVVLLAIILSRRFTRPLLKINKTAKRLSEGDYAIKTDVKTRDEIGQLAETVDMLSQKLYDASIESEKLERLRRNFVSNISHELRTPITVVKGSLEAIKDKVVTGEKKEEYISAAYWESVHLERLVNDLLDLSRLQNMDFKIEMSKIDICDVIADITRSMRQIAKKKNIIINVKKDVSSLSTQGDYGRIRQMLMIVLDNAIKFSPEGETVEITLEKSTLKVKNQGPGIPEEDLPHIFDRFYKTHQDNKEGTGLGLAIAKEIALRHQIQVEACSQMLGETVFSFVFYN